MINIIGNIFGTSGYAAHCKGLANALNRIEPIKLVTEIPSGGERLLNDQELEMIKRKQTNDINIIVAMPQYWKLHTNAKVNCAFLVWEGDKIPKSWCSEVMNKDINYVFVPSEHTRQAVEKTFGNKYGTIADKIHVVPHGCSEVFKPKEKPKDIFRFLMNKGFRNIEDRGGIQYGIKAFIEEFKPEEKVELYIKINPAYGVPDIKKIMQEIVGKEPIRVPPITFIGDNLSEDQMNDLYNKCHVFVSPTRAEAFNIPCLEAMKCGLPVITTNFGGQTDYVDNENGWLIDYKLTEVKWEIMYEGVRWATIDSDKLKSAMREAFVQELGAKSQKAVEKSKEYSWDNTAKKIKDLLC